MTTVTPEISKLGEACGGIVRDYFGDDADELFVAVKYRPRMRDYPWVLEIGRAEVGATGIAAASPEALTEIVEVMLASGEMRRRLFREVEGNQYSHPES